MTFEDILAAIGIKKYKGAGAGEIRICCPFCLERNETLDTRFRLGINTATKKAQCFNCGWKRSAKDTLQLILTKLNHPDAVFESDEKTQEDEEVVTLPEGFEYLNINKLKPWYHKKAIMYLKKREIPGWQIKAKKAGVTILGRYAHRIVWPVVDKKELVGLVARSYFKDVEPRYLNSKGDKFLFNCPADNTIKSIILSEGIFKCLKIERVMMKPSASLLGHHLSEVQIKQLKQFKRLGKVIVFPDPDKVGIKGAIDVCIRIKDIGLTPYIVYPLPEKQADELSDETVKDNIRNAVVFNWAVEQKLKNA